MPLAPAVLAEEATPVASPAASDELYVDPAGMYTVPIPTTWQATAHDGYVQITDTDGLINIYAAAIPEPVLETGITTLWDRLYTEPQPVPMDMVELPDNPDYDRLMSILYDDGVASGRMLWVDAALLDDTSYVMVIDGERDAINRRSSQVSIVENGLDILAVDDVDLAGVMPRELTPEMLAELDAYIETAMVKHDVPGVAVAIVQNGEVVYRRGFGVRDASTSDPVTPETLMMIGSITKPMTTTMMATVVDDGLMTWDTPAQQVLPAFAVADPELSPKVTMRQLVCACTGVPRRDFQFMFNASELSPPDVIESLASFEFYTPFGEAFQYSNQMVAVAGYLATLAAGGSPDSLDADYTSAMQERVFDPIGMSSTTFAMDEVAANPNHAMPHIYGTDLTPESVPLEVEAILDPVLPAASAWSNVDDLARYLITMLDDGKAPGGTSVVSAASLGETWLPQVPIDDDASYGLGWMIDDYNGQPILSHDGNTMGFTADLAFLPEADLGIVILTNAPVSNLFTGAVREWALEMAFEQPHEHEETIDFVLARAEEQLAFYLAAIGPAPAEADVAPFLGAYTSPVLGDVDLRWDGERLMFDAGEFAGEVRPVRGGLARVSSHRLVDGVFRGLTLNLRLADDGTPVLEVMDSIEQSVYPFTRVDAAATPVAVAGTPAASPAVSPAATPLP